MKQITLKHATREESNHTVHFHIVLPHELNHINATIVTAQMIQLHNIKKMNFDIIYLTFNFTNTSQETKRSRAYWTVV